MAWPAILAAVGSLISSDKGGDSKGGSSESSSFDWKKAAGDLIKSPSEPTMPLTPSPGFGDPAGRGVSGNQVPMSHLPAGRLDNRFYGHFLPSHFKKTSIIKTHGRVR